jgi:hypothetical protein
VFPFTMYFSTNDSKQVYVAQRDYRIPCFIS